MCHMGGLVEQEFEINKLLFLMLLQRQIIPFSQTQ